MVTRRASRRSTSRPYDELRVRLAAAAGGAQTFKRQTCVGPIAYVGHDDLGADLAHLRAAVDAAGLAPADAFVNAASPGLVTAFQGNSYFATHEEYVEAVGEAMQVEYEAIVAAGFALQLDCPDLAMARHTGFQDLDDDAFLARADPSRRGAQSRHPQHRPRRHAHAPVLGQLRGSARPRHRAGDGAADRARGSPVGGAVRGRQPPPRPRMADLGRRRHPRRQGARARRHHLHVQLRRPSRSRGRAAGSIRRDRRRRSG